MGESLVLPIEDLSDGMVERCGGKAASLGKLSRMGVTVPSGFCVLAEALETTLAANGIEGRIESIAAGLDFADFNKVENSTAEIRGLIAGVTIPREIEGAILSRYRSLVSDANPYVAVRSSVAVRGSTVSSFPGMMDTYHYVLGEAEVIDKVRECWASLWSARAAFVRHHKGISHRDGIIAPVVQLMVNPDFAGVLFTANPVTKDRGQVVVEANWGLGESVVSGKSMNDFFVVDKATHAVRDRKVARKTVMVTMDRDRGRGRIELPVPAERSTQPTLSDPQLMELARIGSTIESHYGFSVDVEWAFQGGRLFILQARKIRDLAD